MDVFIELNPMGSLGGGVDGGLPSPLDPLAATMMAVFCGDVDVEESLQQDGVYIKQEDLGLSDADSTPAGSASNQSFLGGWSAAALRSSDSSSPQSSALPNMVVDPSWVNSTAQSACADAAADPLMTCEPVGTERTVRRSRAKRGHFVDVAPSEQQEVQTVQMVQQEQPRAKRVKRSAQQQRQLAAAAAAAAAGGPTYSGVLQPFEAVKGYGLGAASLTLQEINAKLKRSWQTTAAASSQ